MLGPKIMAMAPEHNKGRVHLLVDGEEIVLVPGQHLDAHGYGLVVFCECGGDSCHLTVNP